MKRCWLLCVSLLAYMVCVECIEIHFPSCSCTCSCSSSEVENTTTTTTTTPEATTTTTPESTPEPTTTTTPEPCPCIDLMIMVDSSQSVGFSNFLKLRTFTQLVIDRLDISDDCTRAGLFSWSKEADVGVVLGGQDTESLKNQAANMTYFADVSNTHVAVDRFINQIHVFGRGVRFPPACTSVGLLFLDSEPSDWRLTMISLTAMYEIVKSPKIVVVAISPSNDNLDKFRALATGAGEENLIKVNTYNQLDDGLADVVADTIKAPNAANGPAGCTQLAVEETAHTEDGNAVIGAYEKNPNADDCDNASTWTHTRGDFTISRQKVGAWSPLWMVTAGSAGYCTNPTAIYAFDNSKTEEGPPTEVDKWKEVDGVEYMRVVCFN